MIPVSCGACGKPLLLAHLFADDGCPCNSPRGINFTPRRCDICGVDDCVKPGHRQADLFGFAGEQADARREGLDA